MPQQVPPRHRRQKMSVSTSPSISSGGIAHRKGATGEPIIAVVSMTRSEGLQHLATGSTIPNACREYAQGRTPRVQWVFPASYWQV